MLPARHRLPREAFAQVYAEGKRLQTRFLRLRVLATGVPSQKQWAIVVGKKVCKKAVDRNRWKRQLRAQIVALLQQEGLPDTGFQAIVSVVPDRPPLPFPELHAEAIALWQAAGWWPRPKPAKPIRKLPSHGPCREAHSKTDSSC